MRTIVSPAAIATASFVARRWLVFGVLAVLLFPSARASHWLIGWLPFWLVLAPALVLLQARIMAAQAQRVPVRVRRFSR
jgi:hypothetical protein